MEIHVFLAILAAAAMHAGWNAILKMRLDRMLGISLVAGSAGVIALPMLPFAPVPLAGAWPWLAGSVILHVGYNLFLTRAYDRGDMGQVYPIARGSAPLVTALLGFAVVGEVISTLEAAGLVTLVAGVLMMSLFGGTGIRPVDGGAVLPALVTALFIAGYSLTDGLGARASGSPHGYAIWLFALDGVVMILLALWLKGKSGLVQAARHWRSGMAGGLLSFGAYWIVIWAMTKAPIALVAALRESSVLFAAIISVVFLGERLRLPRGIAVAFIVAGVVCLRLA